ncbi:hypothetical protein [Vibrio mangrovi]|uniref:Uncharacterized protein n=1 Tax=Vibrio mangrovi TaxID=474394 RepID=A0A1Y6J0I0_9VIBR|nr:hypothetical protein [Vibrio mangrovi]MDW6005008.1 hypothetical protein [Vibrio mangrovi]SMS01773.1 hypothetical protein VIM7927_03079 [Vibrio mangrovi]
MKTNPAKIIRIIILLVLIGSVAAFFFPKRLYIHYSNPDKPIQAWLYQYDETSDVKDVSQGTVMFVIKRPWLLTFFSPDILASVSWSYKNNRSVVDALDMIAEEGQPDLQNVCRLDLYLDDNAKLLRYEETDFLFLNFCW